MDLIDRQALLDTLDTYWKNEVDKIPKETGFEKLASMCDTILKYSNAIAKLIKHLSSAQPEPQWIPCERELPEEYGEYEITWITSASKNRFIGICECEITSVWDAEHFRFKVEWLLDDYIKAYPDVKVLAWKPLDEPWRGEEHEQDDRCGCADGAFEDALSSRGIWSRVCKQGLRHNA